VAQSDVLGDSPTSGPGPTAKGDWVDRRVFAGLLACLCAPLFAYDWARPRDAVALGPYLERLALHIVPVWGAVLVFFAWRGHLRSGLLLVLALMLGPLAGTLPLVGAEAVGWPGGWAHGAAGLLAGAAYGWLFARLLSLGRRFMVAARGARSPGQTLGAGPGRDAAEPGAPADAGREPGPS
jgi:hypothetical protein